MGVAQLWRMVWAKRLLIVIAGLIGMFGAVAAFRVLPSRYTATSRVILDFVHPDPVTGEVLSTAAAKAYVQTQSELVSDYRVAGAVVDTFGWMKSPELQREYQESRARNDVDFRHWLARIVSDSTSADLADNSNILEISFTSTSPETARKAVDAIRNAYIDQTLAAKRESAVGNARWFREQADVLKQRLAEAEARKTKFEQSNGILMQDDTTDTEMARLKALSTVAPVAAAPVAAAPGAIAPSSGQLATVDAQIANARRTLGPNHPEMLSLLQQRQSLAAAVARETAMARAGSAPRGGGGPSVASMLNEQTRKVLAQRGLVGEAQRLASDITVLRDQLAKTAQRAADFELQAQTTESGLEPLGVAALPFKSSKPSFWLFLIGGITVGIGAGVVLGLLLEILFRRVRGIEDLEAEGLPVLAAMGPSPTRKPRTLLQWLGFSQTASAQLAA